MIFPALKNLFDPDLVTDSYFNEVKMLQWEQEHIRENLPSLIKYTSCDTLLVAELYANKVVNEVEWETLAGIKGRHDRSKILFEIVIARENGYEKVMKALAESNQTGAFKILESGVIKHDPNRLKSKDICVPPSTKVDLIPAGEDIEKTQNLKDWDSVLLSFKLCNLEREKAKRDQEEAQHQSEMIAKRLDKLRKGQPT